MPMPVGGAFAMRIGTSTPYRSTSLTSLDREDLAFKETRLHFSKNLTCILALHSKQIPVYPEKLDGFVLLETREKVAHGGIFILVSGMTIPRRRRMKARRASEVITHLKFAVELSSQVIEENTRKLYHVELGFPEKSNGFPPPTITPDGKLTYKAQVFIYSKEEQGRHALIAETLLEYKGNFSLPMEDKPLRISQQMPFKRPYFGFFGTRKTVNWEFSTDTSSYFPGDDICFCLHLRSEFEIEVECRLELLQKVWYVLPPTRDRTWKDVKLKVNPVTSISTRVHLSDDNKNRAVWKDRLTIPQDQVCTFEIDFNNSVNYVLRITVQGMDVSSSQECKILVGNNREPKSEQDMEPVEPVMLGPCRSRAVSLASLWSTGSEMTVYGLPSPPPYSQLSSRRPTLETRKHY